jgi:hypothetical protein
MRRGTILFVVMVIAACVAQAGSALKINNLEITPAGDLQVGDTVTVRGTVDLGSSSFDQNHYLEFYTQLDKSTVQWEWAIGVDGKYPPATTNGGSYLRIDGWLISYPDLTVEVQVTVDGVVPDTVSSGSLVVFRARELDKDDEVVGTEVLKEKTVFNPAELTAQIAAMETSLATLKASIDEKASAGIGVGDAQTYYTTAKNAISSARGASGGAVTGFLSAAGIAISDGNTALDRAWSQQSIDQAQQSIDSVIGLYNEFTVNRSLKNSDSRLVPITSKRDIAISTLSSAKDDQAAGSYTSARAKAMDARTRAGEAWNLSLDLKKELDSGFSFNFNLGGLLLPAGIILLIAAVVGGIYYWKKYRTWDELG